jgi:hypothetical protein
LGVRQQHQDGGTHIATSTPSTGPTAAPTARAGAEAEAEPAGSETTAEARTETGAKTRAERPFVADVVTADKVAEFTTGLPALFMQRAPYLRVEAEATLDSGASRERPVCVGEWVIHMSSRFGRAARSALPIRRRYIENYRDATVLFGWRLDQGFVAPRTGLHIQG